MVGLKPLANYVAEKRSNPDQLSIEEKRPNPEKLPNEAGNLQMLQIAKKWHRAIKFKPRTNYMAEKRPNPSKLPNAPKNLKALEISKKCNRRSRFKPVGNYMAEKYSSIMFAGNQFGEEE